MIRARVISALILAAAVPALSAAADDVPALLVQKRCNACHSQNAPLIGPAYVAVAARHRANKTEIVEVLARKIVMGGGGTWGLIPMVPNEHVTLDEARLMAQWILTLNPS
jgi:cytochrome c